jgi:hypothetical protein
MSPRRSSLLSQHGPAYSSSHQQLACCMMPTYSSTPRGLYWSTYGRQPNSSRLLVPVGNVYTPHGWLLNIELRCCMHSAAHPLPGGLQETADGELIILHDFHLGDAFPNTGPNLEPYSLLRTQLYLNQDAAAALHVKVGWGGVGGGAGGGGGGQGRMGRTRRPSCGRAAGWGTWGHISKCLARVHRHARPSKLCTA